MKTSEKRTYQISPYVVVIRDAPQASGTVQFEDARWHTYKQSVEFRHRTALKLVASSKEVLDIGAGDGLLLSLIQEKLPNIRVEGADISAEAVQRCREKDIEATLISSAEHLPYADKSFDTLVLLDVLEHTYEPEKILAEALRVAKRRVIIGVPNFSSLPARLQTLRGHVPENNRPSKGHIYWFNKRTLGAVVQKAGGCVGRGNWHMNVQRPFRIFAPLLLRLWPNIFALSFVVVVEPN